MWSGALHRVRVATVKDEANLKPLGTAVRSLRQERGLTQEDLAGATELHRNHIGGIERGERNITIVTLFRLAHALKVPPADLLKGYDH
jgi:transcriptional regulator with XRE-family HTH domain